MREALEIFVAMVTTFGLFLLGWWLLGRLLYPLGRKGAWVILPVCGEALELEETLRGLKWMRSSGFLRCPVLIVDEGLTPTGRRLAERLAEDAEVRFEGAMTGPWSTP